MTERHRGEKPRLLLIKGSGGGPLAPICKSLEQICEVLLVNISTGTSWLEVSAEAAQQAVAGGRDAVIHITDMASARERILAAIEAKPIDAILTPSERHLEFTAELAAELGLLHAKPEVVRRVRDKFAQRSALAENGVPCPKFARIRNDTDLERAIETVPMPIVLKPEYGAGGVDTYRVSTVDELRSIYRRAVDHLTKAGLGPVSFICEELLVGVPWHEGDGWGDYCSVESSIWRGEVMHACVTDRTPLATPFRETGCIIPSTLPVDRLKEVHACAAAALKALGVSHGVAHTEIKFTADGPRIIEVNLRLGGHLGYMMPHGGGDDMVVEAGRQALDEKPKAPLEFANATGLFFLTPPSADHPVRVSGVDRLQGVAHVRDVLANPATLFDWRLGELGDAAIVTAAAPDPETLIDVRRQLIGTLSFE